MTYEEWGKTIEGALALSAAVHCDSFAEADKVLRLAFAAGQRSADKENVKGVS